jgi:hypothetical protein
MKTPREILLEQTQHHDSRLENLQRAVISTSLETEAKCLRVRQPSAAFGSIVERAWSELILPARRIWLAYGFIWIALIAFHLATADRAPTQMAKTTNPSEAIANWTEQQMILAELTKPISHDPADRPREQPMRPRSEAYAIAIG